MFAILKYRIALQSALLSIFLLLFGLQNTIKDDIAVTVIVPVYNVEKYLPQCIESILNQSMKNLELICINDHSTDNSVNIIKYYSKIDKRVRLIDNKKNIGPGASRNEAINIARGEYISFIDSDDWINPDFLKKLYVSAKKYDSDFSLCLITNFSTSENRFYTRGEFIRNELPKKFEKGTFSWRAIMDDVFVIPLNTVNKLHKKSFLLKNNIFFSNTFFLEEHAFSLKSMLFAKKISYVPERLYVYRTNHGHSLSHTNDTKLLKCFAEYKKLERILLAAKAKEIIPQTLDYIVSSAMMRNSAVQLNLKGEYVKIAKKFFRNSKLLAAVDYNTLSPHAKEFLHNLFLHMTDDGEIINPEEFRRLHS